MKVLVTGGAGFIGSHVVDLLIAEGHEVIVVDNLLTGQKKNINKQATFYELDVRLAELKDVFQAHLPEVVYHLAAQSSVPPSIKDPLNDESINVAGVINVLEAMKMVGSRKIIYSSSAAIYGNPLGLPIPETHPIKPVSPYGLSKWIVEEYIELYHRMYNIDYTILRYANIYGPRQIAEGEGGVIAIFSEKIKRGEGLTINGDGRHTRDYVYVGDVAKANYAALTKGSQLVANISTGNAVSLLELIEALKTAANKEIQVKFGPEREGDIIHSTLDPAQALDHLQWQASTQLKEGLKNTLTT